MHRSAAARAGVVLAAILLAVVTACEGDEEKKEGGAREKDGDRAQVTENDLMQCGMSGILFDNRTANGYNVHVRVKNDCTWRMDDTLIPPPDEAHLKVVDAQNRVVAGQDIAISSQQTWRGAVNVPAGDRIVLECGRRAVFTVNHGCSWSYTYSP